MNNSFTFLFPGQGSQFKGMGKNLLGLYKISKDYYSKAEEILGFNILEIEFSYQSKSRFEFWEKIRKHLQANQ